MEYATMLANVLTMGLAERIVKPIKAMYSCLCRRWKLSKEAIGKNGSVQTTYCKVTLKT